MAGGRRFKTEGIYVYLWLIHTVVRQKTTQQYKAIIPSIKNKLKNESHPLSRQERVRSQGINLPSEVLVLAKRQVSAGGSLGANPQTLPSCHPRGSQAPRTQQPSGSSGLLPSLFHTGSRGSSSLVIKGESLCFTSPSKPGNLAKAGSSLGQELFSGAHGWLDCWSFFSSLKSHPWDSLSLE